ncbi:MAG: heparan-alpha-glucosaminide N-acetyltransferase domain-containing protein [Sphingomonas bacterium]
MNPPIGTSGAERSQDNPAKDATPRRLAALDVFRGLAVAGMIIVNEPGSWQHVWWPLDHAPWHGWTPTDIVFPAFFFAVGTALGLSFPRRLEPGDRRLLWGKITRRVLALIALGLAFTLISHHSLETLRLPGVLQRIGLCYGLAAALMLLTARRGPDGLWQLNLPVIAGTALLILVAYWAAMALIPVPGVGAGVLTPEGNLAGYVDRAVLTTRHMWSGGTDAGGNIVYDPEGLLSTFPALVNILCGVFVPVAWRRRPERAAGWIASGGVALLAAGLLLDPLFPLNKRLWTSSFALATSGVSAILFALCMVLCGAATRRAWIDRWLAPFRVFGMNAILAYSLSVLLAIAGVQRIVPPGHGNISPMGWTYLHMVDLVADPWLASFLCSLVLLALVFAAIFPLHRRGIHLRL